MSKGHLTLFIFFIALASAKLTPINKCNVVQKTMLTCLQATGEDLPKISQPIIEWILFSKSNVPIVKKQYLKNFPGLTDFHAEKSGIETVEDDAFQNMASLNWVDISFNKIKRISPNLFQNCPNMYHFNVSGNTELVIPDNEPFLNAPQLKWLDLQQSNIERLSSFTFKNLPGLKYLSLAKNNIKILPDDVFKSLSNLNSLDLSGNKIRTVSVTVFAHMKPLVLHLAGNPWDCDCNLNPVIQWSKRNLVKDDAACVKPDTKKWKEVVLTCPKTNTVA